MIIITKKENLLYIFYNHELYEKTSIITYFHLILFLFSGSYILSFEELYLKKVGQER
ncbi:hypothetical protein LC567_02800 [Fusobacterium animalis]|uniref:hypothetical protein n=1 Tax=Fusobacterium animalis TaxID=76859 RepID=UPI0030CE1C96